MIIWSAAWRVAPDPQLTPVTARLRRSAIDSSYDSGMDPRRRRSHPVKLVAAVVVLLISAGIAVAAVVTATVAALTAATVTAMVAGIAVASLMFAEIVVLRRSAARDRAELAAGYRDEARSRRAAQQVFVDRVAQQISQRDQVIVDQRTELERLRSRAVEIEILLAQARERVAAERGRVDELRADARTTALELDAARADLAAAREAVAAGEAADVAARAELAAWQEAAAAASADVGRETRRTA